MYQPHIWRRDPEHAFWMGHPQFVRLTKDENGPAGSVAPYRNKLEGLWKQTVHNYDAKGNVVGGDKYLVRYGEEHFTGLPVDHPYKYRIPNTSWSPKEGDCRCCGIKPTAAQYIWWPNLLCFLAHLAHVFLTLHYAYWRHDMDPTDPKAAARMLVRVYRITGIPTAEMIANNESIGFDPAKRWTNDFYLRQRHADQLRHPHPLLLRHLGRIPLLGLIAGGFELFWFWYWRQMVRASPCRPPAGHLPATCRPPAGNLPATCRQARAPALRAQDDGFCYWRWLEYSASASIMAMAIAWPGLREQNILAGIFMLQVR